MTRVDPRLAILAQEIETVISGMTADELAWHPLGKWSTAEVLEHLYLTYTGTTKGLQRRREANLPLSVEPGVVKRVRKTIVLRFHFLPSGREAPAFARPRGLHIENVLSDIRAKIIAMDEMISRCEKAFGSGPLLDHIFLGPLTASEWRKFHLIHGRHHLKQIGRLRRAMQSNSKP